MSGAGRTAEDGPLPSKYQLCETSSDGYRQRTRRNVEDSDGTLILNLGLLEGGSLATQRFAQKASRISGRKESSRRWLPRTARRHQPSSRLSTSSSSTMVRTSSPAGSNASSHSSNTRACSHSRWRSRPGQMARRSRCGDAVRLDCFQGAVTPRCGPFDPGPFGWASLAAPAALRQRLKSALRRTDPSAPRRRTGAVEHCRAGPRCQIFQLGAKMATVMSLTLKQSLER
ncbi:YpsA SLOG family protein [Rhodocyclaceae bacterium SMB388]